jgi:hypothetical protein
VKLPAEVCVPGVQVAAAEVGKIVRTEINKIPEKIICKLFAKYFLATGRKLNSPGDVMFRGVNILFLLFSNETIIGLPLNSPALSYNSGFVTDAKLFLGEMILLVVSVCFMFYGLFPISFSISPEVGKRRMRQISQKNLRILLPEKVMARPPLYLGQGNK